MAWVIAAPWLLPVWCAEQPGHEPASAPVVVYYDGPAKPLAEGYLDAYQIQNLLGHFGLSAEIFPIASYETGQLTRYRAAFLLGTASGTKIPPALLADVSAFERPFCWIGRHVDQLVASAAAKRRFGFTYVDYRDDLEFREVVYKGVTLPKEDPDLNIVTVTDAGAVAVVAEAVNDENVRRPYALRRGRFWYVADSPFSYAEEGGRYLVFCDLLHDILEVQHPPQALALARIEDVSTEIDPADLRALADTMSARKVPFQIAIIPVFRNPAKGFEVRLTDRPELAAAIRYMIARGGTPVMHGATHQFDGTSGDDYEFWDAVKNRPIPGDSAAAVMRKLELGFREFQASGIHPVAFETPHYAASETDYRALKEVFSLFYERTMATPDISSIQYFPYPLTDRFGRFVVPENLGYLEASAPDPRALIERARNLRVVRDAVASFYFHAFLDPALLGQVTDGVAALGYRFVSLRQYGGKVNFHDAGPEAPAEVRTPGPFERLKQWWSRLRPSRRPLGASADVAASREALIVWNGGAAGEDAQNQQSYRTVLDTFGYRTREVKREDLRNLKPRSNTLLVVPQAAGRELDGEQQGTLLRYLASGGLVVADGRQSWLSRLGFRWMDRRLPVSHVVDVLYPEMPLVWQPEEMVERFAPPDGVEQLMVDPQSKQVLAEGGEHGAGRFLHLAVPLDSHTPDGTSHFPYFAEYISQVFRLPGLVTSPRLEVYFDPSFRSEVSLSRLAGQWRRQGIRIVHAAAWQFLERHAFDYQGFVRLCHQNGIAVYAWFALPAVTPKFWDEHPEWRERTAAGTPGQVGWRPAMNLQNPACFRAAMDWVKRTLESYEWDGVNLSELNYDADFTDYLRPDRFVPMNDDVRVEFQARAGFDPALLFDTGSPYFHKRNPRALEQFLQYREDVVTEWHRRVLKELEPIERARGSEVVVTMLDSLHSGYVRPALGVDSRRIAGLMKAFGFTLQVEDPAEHWMRSPDRYFAFAAAYLKLVPDRRRLMFDVNVMPNRSVEGTSLPSGLATGSELARMVMAAASVSGRAAIYSEHTVASQDWALIGAALARTARLESDGAGWKIASDVPLRIEASEEREYYVDGAFWPAVSGEGLLAPPGKYRLEFRRPWFQLFDPEDLETRLLYTSGDLLDAHARPTGIAVRYRGPGRTVLLFNKKPLTVRINGRSAGPPAGESGGNWALLAPRGENLVELETATQTGVLLNFWSWFSASAIAAFGAVSTVLMAAIYLHLRLRRAGRGRKEP